MPSRKPTKTQRRKHMKQNHVVTLNPRSGRAHGALDAPQLANTTSNTTSTRRTPPPSTEVPPTGQQGEIHLTLPGTAGELPHFAFSASGSQSMNEHPLRDVLAATSAHLLSLSTAVTDYEESAGVQTLVDGKIRHYGKDEVVAQRAEDAGNDGSRASAVSDHEIEGKIDSEIDEVDQEV